MFVLPALTYALLGATISWASPTPITASDVLNPTDPTDDSAVPPTPDLGINCRGSLFCDLGGEGGESSQLASFINNITDNAWYNNGQLIGASFIHRAIGLL
jgi:hypothetical protein